MVRHQEQVLFLALCRVRRTSLGSRTTSIGVEVINGSGYRCRVAAIDRETVGVCSACTCLLSVVMVTGVGSRARFDICLCRSHCKIVLGVLKLCRNMLSVHHQCINAGGVDGVLGVRASADLQIVAVAGGGYAGDGSASFHISAGVSVHECRSVILLVLHRLFRGVARLEKDELHRRVGVFTPNLLHMPGVRVAGQCERAAPFRFLAFEQRSKVGQTGWARARVSGLGTEEEDRGDDCGDHGYFGDAQAHVPFWLRTGI
mmetsp:Transcript_14173/g.61727  ORF Transcript_14173/g.61727 Transcript_14173/m.61727 type:complete len:259 (+) Transcript_14173:982-1758(+)